MSRIAVSIRRGQVDDAEILGRLLFDFNTEFDTETDSAGVLATRFTRLLPRDDVIALLAEDATGAHGFAFLTLRPAIWFDGPVSQLEELYVVPSRRDQSIGTALIDEARRIVNERGSPEMHINVDEVDVDTRRFYERLGFRNIEAGTDYRMLCYIGGTEPQA